MSGLDDGTRVRQTTGEGRRPLVRRVTRDSSPDKLAEERTEGDLESAVRSSVVDPNLIDGPSRFFMDGAWGTLKGVWNLFRGLYQTTKGGLKTYKNTVDPKFKPKIMDKLYAARTFLGYNSLISLGLYGFNELLFGAEQVENAATFHNLNPTQELVLKGLAYGIPLIYFNLVGRENKEEPGFRNRKLAIVPATIRSLDKERDTTWRNHAAWWMSAAAIVGSFWGTSLNYDIRRVAAEMSMTSPHDWVELLTEEHNLRTLDQHISGKRIVRYGLTIADKVEAAYERIRGVNVTKEDLERAAQPEPGIVYTGEIAERFQEFVKLGWFDSFEEAVLTARAGHFEAPRLPHNFSKMSPEQQEKAKEKLLQDTEAIFQVMLHRWQRYNFVEKRYFSTESEPNFFDIAFSKMPKHYTRKDGSVFTRRVRQFSAIDAPKNKVYFIDKEKLRGVPGLDWYKDGELQFAIGDMLEDQVKSEITLEAFVRVLKGLAPDRTFCHATHFQNKAMSDRHNQNWGKERGEDSFLKYCGSRPPHDFYGIRSDLKWIQRMTSP